jgi:hypothetical protein
MHYNVTSLCSHTQLPSAMMKKNFLHGHFLHLQFIAIVMIITTVCTSRSLGQGQIGFGAVVTYMKSFSSGPLV